MAEKEEQKKKKKSTARAVHLLYRCPNNPDIRSVSRIYNEIKVTETHTGTYFCVIGFNRGYLGLQDKKDNKKVAIFSVWDTGSQNDKNAVPEEKRCKVIHPGDEGTKVGRFGNEGTGGQSKCEFNWKLNETYKFLVEAKVDGEYTTFRGSFYDPGFGKWRRLATFKTITKGILLRRPYSFVEDFSGSKGGSDIKRHAFFGNCWFYVNGGWHHAVKAQFTAARSKKENINAGCCEDRFFLETGGVTGCDCSLNNSMTIPTSITKPDDSMCDLEDVCRVFDETSVCSVPDAACATKNCDIDESESSEFYCPQGALADENDDGHND